MAALETDVLLRWADMDSLGHVNNATTLTLLEEGRVRLLHQAGQHIDHEFGLVVARHEIDYLAPLNYRPQPVAVDVWVTRIGGASYDIGYVIRDPQSFGSTRYAVAETTLALFNLRGGVPRRMSGEERAQLQTHLGDPAPLRSRRSL